MPSQKESHIKKQKLLTLIDEVFNSKILNQLNQEQLNNIFDVFIYNSKSYLTLPKQDKIYLHGYINGKLKGD